MFKAPVPHNEADLLETPRACGILDTDPEQEFNDLAHLASSIYGTPISLIDVDRQGKANIALSPTQTPREVACRAHAILRQGLSASWTARTGRWPPRRWTRYESWAARSSLYSN